MMDFKEEVQNNIRVLGENQNAQKLGIDFIIQTAALKYSYNFSWLSRPIIQFPQDMIAMQELIWAIKPDLIIETGIAHGGSLIFSASMLALLDMCDAIETGTVFDPKKSCRKVLGIDVDIRSYNRKAIEAHPMASRILMIQGSSLDPEIIQQVHTLSSSYSRIMVCLDSNHTHDHVLAELNAYAALTSVTSYCVVFDTVIEDMSKDMFPDRPWGPRNNPKTAVHEFLKNNTNFEIDKEMQNKLLITCAPDGFLRRTG